MLVYVVTAYGILFLWDIQLTAGEVVKETSCEDSMFLQLDVN